MRDRHIPRVCLSCQAPTARQEASCWRCGTQWAPEDIPRTKLQVIDGGAPAIVASRSHPCVAALASAAPGSRLHWDRWTDDGGSVAAQAAVAHGPITGRL